MTNEANKALARRVFDEVINGRHLDLLDEMAASDYIEHNPLPGQRTGIDGIRDRYSFVIGAFEPTFSVDDAIAEGDKVVIRWTASGRHVGDFWGNAPTGRSYTNTGIEIWRIEGDRLVEHWDVVDIFGQMMQLGLLPQPAAR